VSVTWAQRSSKTEAEKNYIFLKIDVPDVDPKKVELDVQPAFLNFSGYSDSKKTNYSVKLEFYAEIDPTASKINHSPRAIELVLRKKELDEKFWPRLLKEAKKMHYLKTDFDKVSARNSLHSTSFSLVKALANEPDPPPTPPPSPKQHVPPRPVASTTSPFYINSRLTSASQYVGLVACWFSVLTFALSKQWVDEDEQDEVTEDEDYMSKMGGMGGGMGAGMGGDGGFGGIDFSKLGGMGGMEGLEGDEGDEEDDEDMPELEGEDETKEGAAGSESKGKQKIEEVE
jgi:hypothetical protein